MAFWSLFFDLVTSFTVWWSEMIARASVVPGVNDPEQWKSSFWAALASAVIGAYAARKSAKEQQRIAEEAKKGTTTTQTSVPYANEYISRLIPYILQEQQKIYESRLKGYGLKPGDYSPIAKLLAGISPNYSGVGGQFGGASSGQGFFDPVNQLNVLTPDERARLEEYAKQNNLSNMAAARIMYGPEGLERNRGARFSEDDDAERLYQKSVYSGVPAGNAKEAGDWLRRQLSGGKGGEALLRMLLGGGGVGGAKFSGAGGSSLFGLGEWSTADKASM